MPLTRAISAYADCESAFRMAADSRNGYRLLFPDHAKANRMQFRMNHYRSLMRDETRRIYPTHDHRWGTSEYDPFMILLKQSAEDDGTWWVYIERATMRAIAGEEIEDSEASPIVEIARPTEPAPLQIDWSKVHANGEPSDLE